PRAGLAGRSEDENPVSIRVVHAFMMARQSESFNGLDPHSFAQDTHLVDILQEHLIRARASGGVFARSVAVPPWGLRLPGTIQLAVHAVVQGRAWLWTEGDEDPLELGPGALALVRGGHDHFVAHEPGAHC